MLRSVGASRSPQTTHCRGEIKSSIRVHQFMSSNQYSHIDIVYVEALAYDVEREAAA